MIKVVYDVTSKDYFDSVNKHEFRINKCVKTIDKMNPRDYKASYEVELLSRKNIYVQKWQLIYEYGIDE